MITETPSVTPSDPADNSITSSGVIAAIVVPIVVALIGAVAAIIAAYQCCKGRGTAQSVLNMVLYLTEQRIDIDITAKQLLWVLVLIVREI